MSEDRKNSPADVKWRSIGAGSLMTFLCAMCTKPSRQLGSGVRRHLGMRAKVCGSCKVK